MVRDPFQQRFESEGAGFRMHTCSLKILDV